MRLLLQRNYSQIFLLYTVSIFREEVTFNGPVSREFGSVNCEYEEQVDAELDKLV